MTKRPYTDVQEMVCAATDQAVDVKITPAVEKLEKATHKLEMITPILQGMVKRQNVHMIWLTVLTAAVVLLYFIVFNQNPGSWLYSFVP